MMTPPRWEHQDVILELHLALRAAAPSGFHVAQGPGVVLAEDQRPIPDLIVVRGERPRTLSNIPAELVVLAAEVVSRSSRSDDRFRKPAVYAQAGIPCYLRVELVPPHLVAYRIGADGLYEETARAEPGGVLTLDAPFPVDVDVDALYR